MFLLTNIIMFVFILLGIAFYTLFERKVLGLAQLRLGPNKNTFYGIFQPLLDGVKLIFKNINKNDNIIMMSIMFSPMLMLTFMFQSWMLMPQMFFMNEFLMSGLVFFICLEMTTLNIIMSGYMFFSNYSFMGATRLGCQSISYQMNMMILVYPIFFMNFNMHINYFFSSVAILFLLNWWLTMVTEVSRTPFDFSEGESELISGFNIEYSSVNFVNIFLTEYGSMLLMCLLTVNIFFYSNLYMYLFLIFNMLLYRAVFPRYRFDLLMKMYWYIIIPFSIMILFMMFLLMF